MIDWTIPANDKPYWKGVPRRYVGAAAQHGAQRADRTRCPCGVHWPTNEEYEALHAAAQIGEQKGSKQWCVEVNVRNSPFVARVTYTHDDTPIPNAPYSPYYSSIVRRSHRDAAGCLNEKTWLGLPVWADQRRPRAVKHTYQDTGLFHGPGDCCDGCRERVDVDHGPVFHHHHHAPRHIEHGRERVMAAFRKVSR